MMRKFDDSFEDMCLDCRQQVFEQDEQLPEDIILQINENNT